MHTPSQLDPETAFSQEQDVDFADEHTKPTYADEHTGRPNTERDESVPPDNDMGGMSVPEPPD